jgi:hypothetical protein
MDEERVVAVLPALIMAQAFDTLCAVTHTLGFSIA